MPRVAILFDNFGPYHVARLAGAARLMDVLAVEVVEKSADYDWNRSAIPDTLTHIPLGARGGAHGTTWRDYQRLFDAKLAPFGPEAVAVCGWVTLADLAATHWATRRGTPVIVMSETTPWDFARPPLVDTIKRRLVRHYSAALCGAHCHKEYLVSLGLAPDAVLLGYDAVDNDYFVKEADSVRGSSAMPELGFGKRLPEAARGQYFLASARFIEKKNLARLVEAYAAFRVGRSNTPDDWPLIILGDGKLRDDLGALRDTLGLDAFIHLPGFRQYGELPSFYATAGAFIHASTTEQWGLVVNEAMASGLPVLVSNRCGCAAELIQEGVNGFTFDPLDTCRMAELMRRIATGEARAAMGAESRRIIADWGPDRFGSGLEAAVDAASKRGPRKLGIVDALLIRAVGERQNRVRNHPSD
ncbi:MAG: glycosyltransferase family 4 protein [Methylocystis silviterrae]|uniref:glycosyltransferase family 4 protein n=1 Tax=Methylocystis silviterrae TaxID=2743612 RepID=UPI003C70A5AC